VLCSGVKVYDMNRSSQHFTMLHNITAVCRLHNTHNNILQLTLLLLHAEILENLLRASLHLICANIFYIKDHKHLVSKITRIDFGVTKRFTITLDVTLPGPETEIVFKYVIKRWT